MRSGAEAEAKAERATLLPEFCGLCQIKSELLHITVDSCHGLEGNFAECMKRDFVGARSLVIFLHAFRYQIEKWAQIWAQRRNG